MKRLLPAVLVFVAGLSAHAQSPGLPFAVASTFIAGVPWQNLVGQTSPFFSSYIGGVVEAEMGSLFMPWLAPTLRVDGGMTSLPRTGEFDLTLPNGSVAAGLALRVPLGSLLALRLSAQGGAYYGDVVAVPNLAAPDGWVPEVDAPGSVGPMVQGTAEFGIALVRGLDLFVNMGYRWYVGLGSTWNFGAGVRYLNEAAATAYNAKRGRGLFGPRDLAPPGPHLKLLDTSIEPLFPVLYRWYADHPFGTATIQNTTKYDLKSVQVRFQPSQHAAAPKLVAQIDDLKRGETREIPLSILFEDTVLGITEGTEISGQIDASYVVDGYESAFKQDLTIPFYDRNSIRWDDDRKVATFVTAKDDEVQRFSKLIGGMVRQDPNRAVSQAFRSAVAAFEAMNAQGLSYVIDPASSYAELSADKSAVDYVQFPRQTLQFLAGDCDDLSVTYNTILEAIGVESAFITVPGHIYAAARLELSEADARRLFADMGELIVRPDGVWLPVEVTALGRSFLEAWRLGAKQWRENSATGTARLYPTHEAWTDYAPVGFSVGRGSVEDVPIADLRARFRRSMESATRAQVGPQLAALEDTLRTKPGDARTINRIGALYAKYGLFADARAALEPLSTGQAVYPAAVINLGNIALLQRDVESAERYYAQALNLTPTSTAALSGMVQAASALGKTAEARKAYDDLARLDPSLAETYIALVGVDSGQGRASDTTEASVRWDDEGGQP